MKGSIIKIVNEDCLKLMKRLGDSSIDAIVTDPPYEIGFNGNAWDSTGIAFSLELWKEALRILKPGGYLLAFSAARTYHRMACAVEDAGFEIRDQMMWLYGSGFPKGINIAKGIDKALGVPPTVIGERVLSTLEGCMFQGREKQFKTVDITVPTSAEAKKWDGWNSTLKPAHEPIVMGRKPFEGSLINNVIQCGTGGIHVDRCRIPGSGSEHPLGRWPANVIMDQEAQKKLEEQQEGASKFFYCPKPTRADKGQKNIHPTVKPTRLMEYLIQLVCPEGGTVFDPFLGSGTTAVAAIRSGVNFQGSELGKEYYKIAQERIEMEQKKQGGKEG